MPGGDTAQNCASQEPCTYITELIGPSILPPPPPYCIWHLLPISHCLYKPRPAHSLSQKTKRRGEDVAICPQRVQLYSVLQLLDLFILRLPKRWLGTLYLLMLTVLEITTGSRTHYLRKISWPLILHWSARSRDRLWLSGQASCQCTPWEAMGDDQVLGPLPPMWEIWIKFLVPVFGLVQPWPLWATGE